MLKTYSGFEYYQYFIILVNLIDHIVAEDATFVFSSCNLRSVSNANLFITYDGLI
jgi:hypothetical protein